MSEAKLYRCKICGDPYIGADKPSRCPHCGAFERFMVDASEYDSTFDVELTQKDKEFAERALEVEISNAEFYYCASAKSKDDLIKNLFKDLGDVEAEHASIWRKILKMDKVDISKNFLGCSNDDRDNLQESHDREDRAIKFYQEAAVNCDNQRLREIFGALVQVETDHLHLSEVRLK